MQAKEDLPLPNSLACVPSSKSCSSALATDIISSSESILVDVLASNSEVGVGAMLISSGSSCVPFLARLLCKSLFCDKLWSAAFLFLVSGGVVRLKVPALLLRSTGKLFCVRWIWSNCVDLLQTKKHRLQNVCNVVVVEQRNGTERDQSADDVIGLMNNRQDTAGGKDYLNDRYDFFKHTCLEASSHDSSTVLYRDISRITNKRTEEKAYNITSDNQLLNYEGSAWCRWHLRALKRAFPTRSLSC